VVAPQHIVGRELKSRAGTTEWTEEATSTATSEVTGSSSPAEPERYGDGERRRLNLNTGRVLVLNATFEPLHISSIKRAVTLLLMEIAERVEDSADFIHSPSVTFAVPSVVRLRRYIKRPPRHKVAFNRKNVLRRDGGICQYCGSTGGDMTLDHVMPRSRGGRTEWENIVTCCKRCNAKKRDRTPQEARIRLIREPFAPRYFFTAQGGLLPAVDPAWRKYLPE